MRQANNDTNRGNSRYPTDGFTYFRIDGYVQSVTQNHKYKCDYLRFCIINNPGDEFYDVVSATLPHDLEIIVDVGDHVECEGYIKSWNRNGTVTLELIITAIKEVLEETPFD